MTLLIVKYSLESNLILDIIVKSVDILIVGAGISGLGLAVHLLKSCPQLNFNILENRERIGGTWDLFKYPGIRSDSDMTTFGYSFKPWTKKSILADGASIQQYLYEVVEEYGLEQYIHFNHKVINANFDTTIQKWLVTVQNHLGEINKIETKYFMGCTGYYHYDQPYQPNFNQQNNFKGQLIHPQLWPENLEYKNKKVVVIGSGATAITIVPAMVKGGVGHITMLQRSPTYIASIPALDALYAKLSQVVPTKYAYMFTRARNIGMQRFIYVLAQKYPKLLKHFLLKDIQKNLENKIDLKHFTPTYNPWEQRLCVVPNGDLFEVLKTDKADIETNEIDQFTEQGIQLKSGKHLDADIIISATGLNIQVLGGIQASVDDQVIDTSNTMLYQGVMVSDVPNMFMMIGYINASWTLKVDIASEYLCRLFNYMDNNHYKSVVAPKQENAIKDETIMGKMSSGYIARASGVLPKQGKFAPWQVTNNYLADKKVYKHAKFEDGVLKFTS